MRLGITCCISLFHLSSKVHRKGDFIFLLCLIPIDYFIIHLFFSLANVIHPGIFSALLPWRRESDDSQAERCCRAEIGRSGFVFNPCHEGSSCYIWELSDLLTWLLGKLLKWADRDKRHSCDCYIHPVWSNNRFDIPQVWIVKRNPLSMNNSITWWCYLICSSCCCHIMGFVLTLLWNKTIWLDNIWLKTTRFLYRGGNTPTRQSMPAARGEDTDRAMYMYT